MTRRALSRRVMVRSTLPLLGCPNRPKVGNGAKHSSAPWVSQPTEGGKSGVGRQISGRSKFLIDFMKFGISNDHMRSKAGQISNI